MKCLKTTSRNSEKEMYVGHVAVLRASGGLPNSSRNRLASYLVDLKGFMKCLKLQWAEKYKH